MVSASTEFVKSGFGEEQSAELAQISELFRNVADEEISSAESAGFIISQMKAYGNETTAFAEHTVNAINEVSNNMSVSSSDIQSGLSKTAAAMATAGNDFNKSVALITASTEVMHGQANKVSRGFRTISANIAQMASKTGELSFTVQGQAKSIKLLDEETGDLKDTFEVFQDIYLNGWQQMTNAEKEALGLQIANKTQLEVALSGLDNFASAQKALGLAIESENSAWKENEKYLESIEAKVAKVRTAFSNLVLGDGGLSKVVKVVLDLTAGFLEFIDNHTALIVAVTATTVALVGLNKQLTITKSFTVGNLFGGIVESIGFFITQIMTAETATAGLNTALEMLSINPVVAMLAGVTIAVTAGVLAFEHFNVTAKESKEKLEELAQTTDKTKTEFDGLKGKLGTLDSQISELENQKLSITDPEDSKNLDSQLSKLKEQKTELETQLEILKRKLDLEKEEEESQAIETANKNQDSKTIKGYGKVEGNAQEQLQNYMDAYNSFGEKIKETNEKINEAEKQGLNEKAESLKKQLSMYEDGQEKAKQYATDMASVVSDINNSLYGLTDESKELKDSNDSALESYRLLFNLSERGIDTTQDLVDQYNELSSEIEGGAEAIENYAEMNGYLDGLTEGTDEWYQALMNAGLEMESAISQTDAMTQSVQSFVDEVSSLSDAYGILSNAQDEYNETGGYSLDTLNKLLPLMAQYGELFDIVDGKINIHTEDIYKLIEAEAEEQKSVIRGTAIAKLNALEQENSGKSAKESGNKHSDATIGIDANTESLDKNTEAAVKNAKAQAIRRGADKKEVESIISEMQADIDLIDKAVEGMNTSFTDSTSKAAKKGASSHKSSAKESKDAWLEAYKAEKDALDSLYKTGVINADEYAVKLQALGDKYLLDSAEHQKKYAEQIHSLYEEIYKSLQKSAKDALDEMKDTHKKAEDSLKSQHEEQEKAIKRQIELLKRQKDAIKDSYDAQIEALKREREEYENQIKLMKLKEELAKAEQTYQYVMDESGRFNWVQDQEAVDEKQEELHEENLKQSYERQLQALEDARDAAVKQYEQQIQDLEDYYDRVKDANDRAEEQLKAHNDEIEKLYEKATSDYETYATMLANGQLDQIANENSNWATRLNNLANFVNNYNALMNKLGDGSTGNGANANFKGGTSYTPTSSSGGGTKSKVKPDGVKYSKGSFSLADKAKIRASLGKHASGVASIDSDEMALVGDSPNQELVIGSRLNGIPLSLNAGSGVVNAKSTKTFAGLLNSLPKLSNNYSTTNNSNQQVIHVDNINLPQVTNGEEFIDYLQNFDIDMIQRSF